MLMVSPIMKASKNREYYPRNNCNLKPKYVKHDDEGLNSSIH